MLLVLVGLNVLEFTSWVSYEISPLTYRERSEWFTVTAGLQNDSQKSKPSSTSIRLCNKIFYCYGFECPAVYGNSDIKSLEAIKDHYSEDYFVLMTDCLTGGKILLKSFREHDI